MCSAALPERHLHDGPGAEDFVPSVAKSDHEFDVWFRTSVQEIHGLDFENPPPPPELGLDARA